MIVQKRRVYSVMEFFGDFGGLIDLIIYLITFLISPIISTLFKISLVSSNFLESDAEADVKSYENICYEN